MLMDTSDLTIQHRIQRLGGAGVKKHEIYVAAFCSHLFYDLFLQGFWEGAWPPWHPSGSATAITDVQPGNAVKIQTSCYCFHPGIFWWTPTI